MGSGDLRASRIAHKVAKLKNLVSADILSILSLGCHGINAAAVETVQLFTMMFTKYLH